MLAKTLSDLDDLREVTAKLEARGDEGAPFVANLKRQSEKIVAAYDKLREETAKIPPPKDSGML